MKKLLGVLLLGFVVAFNCSGASTNLPPTSAEQLRSEFEAALKAGDTNTIFSLYNWDGVSDGMRKLPAFWTSNFLKILSQLSTNKMRVFAVLRPLPDDFETEAIRNGVRYRSNVALVGMISGYLPGWGVQIPYGETNGAFYLAGTTTEKIYEPKTKEKSLDVYVSCEVITDNSPAFTGVYTYVQNGMEIKKVIRGKGMARKMASGDYVKSCFVQNTSGGTNLLKLEICEDGKRIFNPEIIETNGSISYEKKN
jgi:hypothetical protein